ncbi:MAG: hypothetical protein HKM04_03455 [Legionellales bacterium]|nr:hypothetical protein [Legionellales bacterium]
MKKKEQLQINKLCHDALNYICHNITKISPNIVDAAEYLIPRQYNYNFNGVLGYVLPHPSKEKSKKLCPKKSKNYQQLKLSFFYNINTEKVNCEKKLIRARQSIKEAHQQKPRRSLVGLFAESALNMEGGNCTELTFLAYRFLKKRAAEKDVHVKIYVGKNFDHAFLVLGNLDGEGVLPDDFTTWPKDIVILDPWLRCQFELKDMPLYWRDMAYAHDWAKMRSWENSAEIMQAKCIPDDNHPFFKEFVPQTLEEFLKSRKSAADENSNLPPVEQLVLA